MKITERQLRKVIRDVIQEVRAVEDEELLKIGGDFYESGEDYDQLEKFHYRYAIQDNEKVMQLFKAWCYKNDLDGMDEEEIVDFFFRDYPHLKKSSSSSESVGFVDDLKDHAREMIVKYSRIK